MLKKLFSKLGKGNSSYGEHDYVLVPIREDYGNGYVILRVRDNQRLQWRTLAEGSGLQAFNVAGASRRPNQLQDPSFAPGHKVSLIPEPTNPYDENAVAVYDEKESIHVGYVPRDQAVRIKKRLDSGESPICISMWQTLSKGKRVSFRVLIIAPGTNIKMPHSSS